MTTWQIGVCEECGRPLYSNNVAGMFVGGESGFRRRELDLQALESVVNQCAQKNVPCFVKQDSAFKSGQQGRIPAELFVREFPKGMAPA